MYPCYRYCETVNKCACKGRYLPAWGYTAIIGVLIALAGIYALVRPASAAEILETSNTTAGSNDGTSGMIYIGEPDRSTLYEHSGDNLTGITVKVHNGTGHNCTSQNLRAYVNAIETPSDLSEFDINNGADLEVRIDFTENPDIVLDTITQIRLSISSCWGGLTYFYNSTNVWGADAGTYYHTAPKDPYIKIYGDYVDPTLSPTTTVYDPPTDTEADQLVWNAPYLFRLKTNVDVDEYPDKIVLFKVEIKEGERVVYTTPALPYLSSNTTYDNKYALLFYNPVHFNESVYTIRGKALVGCESCVWGEWGDPVELTSVNSLITAPVFTWPENPDCSLFDLGTCIGDVLQWVLIPSTTAFEQFFEQLSLLGTRYPFVRIGEMGALLAAPYDTESEPDEPDPCTGTLDASCISPDWIASGIKDFYDENPGLGLAFGVVIVLLTVSTVLGDLTMVFL